MLEQDRLGSLIGSNRACEGEAGMYRLLVHFTTSFSLKTTSADLSGMPNLTYGPQLINDARRYAAKSNPVYGLEFGAMMPIDRMIGAVLVRECQLTHVNNTSSPVGRTGGLLERAGMLVVGRTGTEQDSVDLSEINTHAGATIVSMEPTRAETCAQPLFGIRVLAKNPRARLRRQRVQDIFVAVYHGVNPIVVGPDELV